MTILNEQQKKKLREILDKRLLSPKKGGFNTEELAILDYNDISKLVLVMYEWEENGLLKKSLAQSALHPAKIFVENLLSKTWPNCSVWRECYEWRKELLDYITNKEIKGIEEAIMIIEKMKYILLGYSLANNLCLDCQQLEEDLEGFLISAHKRWV